MTAAPRSRVVITGIGVVSAHGWGSGPLWSGLSTGSCSIGEFDRIDHSDYRTHIAAQVPDPPANLRERLKAWRGYALADRFGLAAALEALKQSRWLESISEHEAGVYFGSSTGGMLETERFYSDLRGSRPVRLRDIASQQVSAPGNAVARTFGFRGPVQTESSACASGALAIGMALDAIRSGEVEVALAGGADSLCRTTYGGFNALRSVDPRACRPFLEDREGLSLGEGGAALILETLDSARSRGVEPLAELLGAGSAGDAHHMTAPDPAGTGAARALRIALSDGRTTADRIDFVNAHGTGTPRNDAAEWQAIQAVFGERAASLPVTSTKGLVGHLLGSAGSLESVATILCLREGVVHPTPGDGAVDPEAAVRLVRDEPLPISPMRQAVSANLGFGGCNAALVFSRMEESG